MGKLDGKVAWITGAGSGIGEAGALALAASGARVVLSGRRADALETLARRIGAGGGAAEVEVLDVSDAQAVRRVAAAIVERHRQIDILVNSAGTNTPTRKWTEQSVAGWREVVGINLDGSFHTVHAVLPGMRERGDGLIINVASWAGVHHSTFTGAAYNASKHAVVAMTETINIEEGVNGIRACALCPGEVATPILDRRPVPPNAEVRARMLQPHDLGDTIRFIAEAPPNVCINQLLISPTWNRIHVERL